LIDTNVIEVPEIDVDQHILSVIALPATIDNDIAMTGNLNLNYIYIYIYFFFKKKKKN